MLTKPSYSTQAKLMIPHKNSEGRVEWFEHPNPSKPERTLVQVFVKDAGLGNQIMEISGGYGIAKRLGMHFRWSWNPSSLRAFGLGHWGFAETRYADVPVVAERLGQGSLILVRKCEEAVIKHSKYEMVGISCPFQDEACFRDHADEIREIFKLEPFDLPNPEGTTPVGVQVRRGDYVGHSRLNVTTPGYFLGALQWMRANVLNPHFIIVSDDPIYAEKLFATQFDVTVMPDQSAIDGLRTLASCKAHCISNSTFGWWGAWLGESGPVVVPEYWHHEPGSYGAWNPVPDRWIKLPVGQEVRRRPAAVIKSRVVMELPAPGIERAIVYPWHADQAKWQELRYSLRSVEKHFADKKCPIFVFGTKRPPFIKDGGRVQYRGAYTYSEALSNGVQVADKVMWLNDDVIFLKHTDWSDCEIPYYLKEVGPTFVQNAETNSNPWREGCVKVLRQLAEMGITDQKVYSTHLPYVWERKKALEVFEKFGVFEKFPMELGYFHLFPEGSKPLTTERAHGWPDDVARFLNYADVHLSDSLKSEIHRRFPDYAEWEVKIPF